MRGRVRERILRVIANNPGGNLSRYELAKEAVATYPWVREFLLKLESAGLVKGTRVLDFPALMRFWQSVYIKHRYREYMVKAPLQVLRDSRLSYALTTYQGENLIQSYLFPGRIDVYVKESEWKLWHEVLTKKGLVGRGNLRLLLSDEHVFYKAFERDGLKVVSLPQLIVDLLVEGGVCTEAAGLLIERVVRDVRAL